MQVGLLGYLLKIQRKMATDVEKLINEDVEKTLIRNLRSIGFVIDDEDEANEEVCF